MEEIQFSTEILILKLGNKIKSSRELISTFNSSIDHIIEKSIGNENSLIDLGAIWSNFTRFLLLGFSSLCAFE